MKRVMFYKQDMSEAIEQSHISPDRINTSDGKTYLFRYDFPSEERKKPEEYLSGQELVGQWFTDSIKNLGSYIGTRKPGGTIIAVPVDTEKLPSLSALEHQIANKGDIEADNYILSEDIREGAKFYPLTVPAQNPNRFNIGDWDAIRNFLSHIREELTTPEQISE